MFTLIIIRVGLGYTVDNSTGPGRVSDHRGAGMGRTGQLSTTDYPLRPVAINVSVQREHDRSSLELYDTKDPGHLEAGTAS